jgi:hypothetical protein
MAIYRQLRSTGTILPTRMLVHLLTWIVPRSRMDASDKDGIDDLISESLGAAYRSRKLANMTGVLQQQGKRSIDSHPDRQLERASACSVRR